MISLTRLKDVPVYKKFVIDGLLATKQAFEFIDYVPAVDPNKPGQKIAPS